LWRFGLKRRLLAIGATCVAVIASVLVAATPANADPFPCSNVWPSADPGAKCAHVIGIAPGSYLNVRSGPGSSYSVVRTLTNGEVVELYCWTTGTYVNGYNIWTRFDTIDNHPEYVSDYYLDTGYVQAFLPHC
jgi:uncharacterized protein YgiM (DUF1202 family)